jgi:hypothetical protein
MVQFKPYEAVWVSVSQQRNKQPHVRHASTRGTRPSFI